MHRKWWTLLAVSVATFMLLLDITVVNTALPSIHDDLGASFTDLQWVIDAYTLSLAALVLTAGVLADRLGRRDVRWWMWIPAIACAGPLPFTLTFLLVGDPNLALLISFPGVVIAAMYQGPVFSTVQTLAPVRMRAVASGVLMFVTNIIGLALGPQSIGWLNDYVFASHGDEAVRYSLLLVLLVMGVWSTLHFMLAARALPFDLARGDR